MLLAYHGERYVQSHTSFVAFLDAPACGGIAMADTTILVVDDTPQLRRVLRTTLSGNGYDVRSADVSFSPVSPATSSTAVRVVVLRFVSRVH